MERLARLVMHHRRIVSAIWLALFVGGLFSASQLGNRWTLRLLAARPARRPGRAAAARHLRRQLDEHLRRARHRAAGPDRRREPRARSARSSPRRWRPSPTCSCSVVDLASTGDPGFVTE